MSENPLHLSSPADMTRPGNSMLTSSLQNVETFGTFLGEEIVSNWRKGYEMPATSKSTPHSLFSNNPLRQSHQHHHQQQQHNSNNISSSINHSNKTMNTNLTNTNSNHLISNPNLNSIITDDHGNRHQDDKSSHHDASSTASTPILQDSRFDNDNQNGGGLTPMSLPISKSPQEDNNNHLGALPVHGGPTNFSLGLPFHHQMQERYRFADELTMGPGSMAGRLGDSLIPKGDPMEARLQEMLRYNMDKYANQNLDTLHISRRVRELLSVHNVGQRLFAKYVLGLSQGTVSELLSKPKPWDKLTEKGRDSYRKMHAWACDDNAVLLLKSLIPKKGE